MTHAYVEHRPKSTDKDEAVTSHVVIVNHEVVFNSKTQRESEIWANDKGYTVHVARERHLQDRDTPAHWRKSFIS